jgi:probable rRNA maturation factor
MEAIGLANVKVEIVNRQREVKTLSGLRLLIKRCCNAVAQAEDFTEPSEVSVSFVNNQQIRELNKDYRQKDIETDVLSFPMGENGKYDQNRQTGALILGDIVISLQKAAEQAEMYGHLLGYDHEQGGLQAAIMREKEEAILESLSLSRDISYKT